MLLPTLRDCSDSRSEASKQGEKRAPGQNAPRVSPHFSTTLHPPRRPGQPRRSPPLLGVGVVQSQGEGSPVQFLEIFKGAAWQPRSHWPPFCLEALCASYFRLDFAGPAFWAGL